MKFIKFVLPLVLISGSSFGALISLDSCSEIFQNRDLPKVLNQKVLNQKVLNERALMDQISEKITEVPEFAFIQQLAQERGVRVWLFGGTASSFLHYVRLDLLSKLGLRDLQREHFDYDFTNIFRSTQDIDIVVDTLPEVAAQMQSTISRKFPHFLGDQANHWEVRTLRKRIGFPGEFGFKEALLEDPDFLLQDSDSHSLGMIEITAVQGEPRVRDLRHWEQSKSIFLEDALNEKISYFRSNQHFSTARAKAGENPEILSVIRLLVKAFQYELHFSPSDLKVMKKIIDRFEPHMIETPIARRKILETAKKLVIHAVNVEYAMNQLDQLGLREKLIAMGNKDDVNSSSWWLNREPLRSQPIGLGAGRTAQELGLKIVAHETNHFSGYEAITRAYSGAPNILISRSAVPGETATFGDGFYVRKGIEGGRGTGLTIRFSVDPKAREGSDFDLTEVTGWVVFKNKKALKVIPETLSFEWNDLLYFSENEVELRIPLFDYGLLEKFKRRLRPAKVTHDFEKLLNSDHEEDRFRLNQILGALQSTNLSELISPQVLESSLRNIYLSFEPLSRSSNETDLLKYVKNTGILISSLDSFKILKVDDFVGFLVKLFRSQNRSFDLRKQVLFEILLNSKPFEPRIELKKELSQKELTHLVHEIDGWVESADSRKRKYRIVLDEEWSQAIKNGEIDQRLIPWINFGLFDINHKNISDLSILQIASYYSRNDVLEWLIQHPEFDFNSKNRLGSTEIDQLRLNGKSEWADQIQRRRPDAQGRKIELKERRTHEISSEYPEGAPIIDFIEVSPGAFFMGSSKEHVLTTLTQPFEIMSVDTSQKLYHEVTRVLQERVGGDYLKLNLNLISVPSSDSIPIYGLSFNAVDLWKKGLNELSSSGDQQVQEILKSLLPGHQKGDEYDLPTEAEWEWVSRLGGLAEGDYSFGEDPQLLDQYAVYSLTNYLSPLGLIPVGSKKPVFYLGKPIYDLHGLLWRWTKDWYHKRLKGGRDPQGPLVGLTRVVRAGCYSSPYYVVTSHSRHFSEVDLPNQFTGFRLVRRKRGEMAHLNVLDPSKNEIHYEVYGAENSETLVLIHGLDSATRTFDSIIEPLSKKYRVIAYDQRGHGQSLAKGDQYSTEILAMDLKALLDYLQIKQIHLLGHSLGGRTAARFASLFPDRVDSLMIEDMELLPRINPSKERLAHYQQSVREMDDKFKVKTFSSRQELVSALQPYYGDEAVSISYRRARENEDGSLTLLFNPEVSVRYGFQANTEDLSSELEKFKKPVLIFRADSNKGSAMSDRGVADLMEKLPSAQWVMIPDSGHVIHRTHAEAFVDFIFQFHLGVLTSLNPKLPARTLGK